MAWVLGRAGLRNSEGLALNETDLDPGRGSLPVRHRKRDHGSTAIYRAWASSLGRMPREREQEEGP